MVQFSHPHMITGKTIALTIWTFVSKVMSLLFNVLSRFLIVFLPRSKCLLILWLYHCLQWFWSPTNKLCHCFQFFPFYLPWRAGPYAMILFFWMLSFKPAFSLSFFTFSSFSVSAIRLVSSTYLRLLIFLQATLISACDSSSLEFYMAYSVYKLNKQGDNMQPCHTPFPIWNQSVDPCPVQTVASWLLHQRFGHKLGLLWCWLVYLGNKLRSFCHFWDCTWVLHFRLFRWLWELLHFFLWILAHSRRHNCHLN